MVSTLPYSLGEDAFRNNIKFDTDTFYVMLLTSSYTPNQAHAKRSDLTNEVSGTGYSAGGIPIGATVSRASGVTSVTFAPAVWAAPTNGWTARWGVIYKRRGGAASADELVATLDFGGGVAANGTTFTVTPQTALTLTVS